MAWLAVFLIIVILNFIVPYTVLEDVASFYGSYSFWAVLTVVTIALGFIYMRSWRE